MMKWDPSYATGVDEIDKQHILLFDAVSRLGNEIGKNTPENSLRDILDYLRTYSEFHFDFEEQCMSEFKCPTACQNKAAHREFKQLIIEYETVVQRDGPSEQIARQLYKTLALWLVDHICTIDQALKPCLLKSHNDRQNR